MGLCEWRHTSGQIECIHCGRVVRTSSRTAGMICPKNDAPFLVPAPNRSAGGPGTELKAMLSGWPFYITALPGCPCNEHAKQMDAWGPDVCEQRINEIVAWLQLEATGRGLPFSTLAAKLLVRRAIAKARRARPPS